MPTTAGKKPGWKRGAKLAFTILVLGVTLVGVGRHIHKAWDDLRATALQIESVPLIAAGVFYSAGLFILGAPWLIALRTLGDNGSAWRIVPTYVISHLGKYVPGKAMVLVIRWGLLRKQNTTLAVVTISSIFETLSTMASGSLLAAAVLFAGLARPEFLAAVHSRPILLLAVVGLTVGFCGAIFPAVFDALARILSRPWPELLVRERLSPGYGKTLACLAIATLTWILWGFAYGSVLRSVGVNSVGFSDGAMLSACVAISIVGGFVTFLPGQAVVREWVLMETLAPIVGESQAVAAALLFRVVTSACELLLAALLGGMVRK